MPRPIHSDFRYYLDFKSAELIDLYVELREFLFSIQPDCNELLYHSHALTSVFSLSEKLGDGFCHIPIYTNHLNLGFNKGALLADPDGLLQGTGKLIRHIPVRETADYKNKKVEKMILSAVTLCREDGSGIEQATGKTISKIKIQK